METSIIIDTFIDIGKFSLIDFRKSHGIWWLFVRPFKSYNSLKTTRAQCAPPPSPGLNRVKCLIRDWCRTSRTDFERNEKFQDDIPARPNYLRMTLLVSINSHYNGTKIAVNSSKMGKLVVIERVKLESTKRAFFYKGADIFNNCIWT